MITEGIVKSQYDIIDTVIQSIEYVIEYALLYPMYIVSIL